MVVIVNPANNSALSSAVVRNELQQLSDRIDTKQGTLTLTTTGSSGAATLVGSALNIPNYSGGGGTWGDIVGDINDQTDLQNEFALFVPYTGATANVDLATTGRDILANRFINLQGSSTWIAGNSGTLTSPVGDGILIQAGNGFSLGDNDGGDINFTVGKRNGAGNNGRFLFQQTFGPIGIGNLDFSGLTGGIRTFAFPNSDGTIALTSDLSGFIPYSIITAKGDIIVGTGAGMATALPVGTDGFFLQADSTQAEGVKWAATGGGDVTGPGSSIDSNIVLFDGTTGKIIKDSGTQLSDLVPYTGAVSSLDMGLFGIKAFNYGADDSFDTIIYAPDGIVTHVNGNNVSITAGAAYSAGVNDGGNIIFASGLNNAGGNLGSYKFTNPTNGRLGELDFSIITLPHKYTFPDNTGTIALVSDLTNGYVPYSGASADITLGTFSIQTNSVLGYELNTLQIEAANGIVSNTTGKDLNLSAGNAYSVGNHDGGNIKLFIGQPNGTGDPGTLDITSGVAGAGTATLNFNGLVSSQTFTFPDATGTIALTADLTGFVPYTGATTNVNLGTHSMLATNYSGDDNFTIFSNSGTVSVPVGRSISLRTGDGYSIGTNDAGIFTIRLGHGYNGGSNGKLIIFPDNSSSNNGVLDFNSITGLNRVFTFPDQTGTIQLRQQPFHSTAISYAVQNTDQIIHVTVAGVTITLPTAVGLTGVEYKIKNASGGDITVNTTASQTIDGQLTQTLSSFSSMSVYSNNANWFID